MIMCASLPHSNVDIGLTANALVKAIAPKRITAILKDERGITGTQLAGWMAVRAKG